MTRLLSTALLLSIVACGGSSSKPAAPPPQQPQQRTAADLGPMCDRYYVHQRTCSNEYLTALVTMRAEYDMPPGIAAHVKDKGTEAVVAEARVEWETDTTPEKTAAMCQAMATKTPAEHVERLLKDGDTCEALTDCSAFAKCAIDTERTYVKERMQH